MSQADEVHELAATLAPALRQACGGKLSEISWFRAAWQHSSAATGFASWSDNGGSRDVMVKLPVGPVELEWTVALGQPGQNPPVPEVVQQGSSIGGYDLAWMVIEKLAGQPLSQHLDAESVTELLHAAAEFQARAIATRPSVDLPPPKRDWEGLIDKGRKLARDGALAEDQRWNEALKKVQKVLAALVARWESRPLNAWCHGDLHPGNALRRASRNGPGRCVLIDLALVHAGHWVEDAVYLERLYWARPELLHGVKPVATLARFRRELGLPTDDHAPEGHRYADYANIRRALMSAVVPAYVDREGHPRYTHAALDVLERCLPLIQ